MIVPKFALNGEKPEGAMSGSALQKVTYVLLIVLLFGVTSGWLGGL